MTTPTKTPTPSPLLLFALTCVLLVAIHLGTPITTLWAVTAMVIAIASGGSRPQNRDER